MEHGIALFERSDRIGGRLHSPTIGCHAAQGDSASRIDALPRCELGGMRIRASDVFVHGVAEALNVSLGNFYMNSENSGPDDDPLNPAALRGSIVTRLLVTNELQAADGGNLPRLPYEFTSFIPRLPDNVDGSGHTGTAASMHLYGDPPMAFYNMTSLPNTPNEPYDPCSSNNWRILEQPLPAPDGPPVWAYTRDTAGRLLAGTSSEGSAFGNDFSGYRIAQINLAAATDPFVPGDQGDGQAEPGKPLIGPFSRPLLGMQELPLAMSAAFLSAGGETQMNMQLLRIEVLDGDEQASNSSDIGKLKLTFVETATNPCTEITERISKDGVGDTRVVYADKVVLAGMPTETLASLFEPQSQLAAEAAAAVDMVDLNNYGKFFLAFNTSERNISTAALSGANGTHWEAGRFVASSDVQQAFKWWPGTQARSPNETSAADCEDVTVLQVYSQSPLLRVAVNTPQWSCVPNVTLDTCDLCENATNWVGRPHDHFPAALADLLLTQLALMLNVSVTELPPLLEAKYEWHEISNPQSPAAAWHFWRPGKWWETFASVLQPVDDVPVYIVGEAFSFDQGWVEGALETTEMMLQEKLSVARPAWLSRNDYCTAMPYYPDKRRFAS